MENAFDEKIEENKPKIVKITGRQVEGDVETVINIYGNEKTATVFTYHKPIMRRLRQNQCAKIVTEVLQVQTGRIVGLEAILPRNCISFRSKPRTRF